MSDGEREEEEEMVKYKNSKGQWLLQISFTNLIVKGNKEFKVKQLSIIIRL